MICLNHDNYPALLMGLTKMIAYVCDPDTYELHYLSKAAMDVFGVSSSEVYKGKKCYEILHGAESPCADCSSCRLSEGKLYQRELYSEKLGRWFDVGDTLATHDGKQYRISMARDISARREIHSPLADDASTEDVLFRCLHVLATEPDLHHAIDLFLSYVGNYYQADRVHIFEIDYENRKFRSTFEWHREGNDWNSAPLKDIPLTMAKDIIGRFRSGGAFSLDPICVDLDDHGGSTLELRKRHRFLVTPLVHNDTLVGVLGISDPGRDDAYLGLLRSVSEFILAELEKRRLLEELETLSYTDILTQCANRNRYTKDMAELLLDPPGCLGVISLTINGLKGINETLGQQYGDELIARTARRLIDHTSGTVYRIGGDEFIVFSPNMEHDPFVTTVTDLIAAFRDETEYSVSIGYEWDAGAELHEQIHRAQTWMHSRKQHFYQLEFVKGRSTGSSAEDLLNDIKNGRFEVWYQPQVNLQTGAIIGAEALVRKRDEEGNLIPPMQFIPHYEARNVISHLDMHVLETALSTLHKLRKDGIDLPISVNFSRATLLVPDFSAIFHRLCECYDVPHDRITLEVTETVSTLGLETLQELLSYFHNSGLRLSLDDFGSKYSNLAILTGIEFDEIKFDKTLLDDICVNARSRIILNDLIEMCRKLQTGTHIVAEGIEDAEQAEILKNYPHVSGQGYHFHRPMPLNDLRKLLENQKNNEASTGKEGE